MRPLKRFVSRSTSEDKFAPALLPATIIQGAPQISARAADFSAARSPYKQEAPKAATRVLHCHSRDGVALFVDMLFIVSTSVVTGVGYHQIALGAPGDVSDFVATGLVAAVIFCGVTRLIESHHPLKISDAFDRARDSAVAWLLTSLLFVFATFTLKVGEDLSRGAVLTFFVFGMAAIVISRVNTPVLLAQAKSSGAFARRDSMLLGVRGDPNLPWLAEIIHQGVGSYPRIVTFDANCEGRAWAVERKAVHENVLQLAKSLGPGEIYVASSNVPTQRLNSVLRSLSLLPRAVLLVPDAGTAALLRYQATAVGDAVALQVQKEPLNATQRAIKRAMDLVIASVLLVLLAPFLVAVTLAIKLDSSGPVLFRQLRYGYRGRPFRILKFRTMTVLEDGQTVTQATLQDSRVTRVGRWLRKNSIDELPQLFNVIRGEMSLVGPRPHARAHDEFYARIIENYELRQHVKPGITGWAQANGLRGETAHVDRMYRRIEHDLWYAKHCSLTLDLQILVRTILVVVTRQHAY